MFVDTIYSLVHRKWLGRLFSSWSIAKKLIYNYVLAISIAVIGTIVGLEVGKNYEEKAMARLRIADTELHLLQGLENTVRGMRTHPERLVATQSRAIWFDYERAKFVEDINRVKARLEDLQTFTDSHGDASEGIDASQFSEILTAYQRTTELEMERVDYLWSEIDMENLKPEEAPAAQQMVLVELGKATRKIGVEFDRLSANLTELIETAETKHEQATAQLQKYKSIEQAIILASMLLSAAIALWLAVYTSRAIVRPLEWVIQVAQRVTTDANFQLRAPVTTEDEVGSLAIALNQLIQWVGEYTDELERSRDNLEQRVSERTEELRQALRELRETESQLIQTAKMSSLEQMVAGIAHEINNPVSFIYGNLEYAKGYTKDLLELVRLYQEQYPNKTPDIEDKIAAIELDFLGEDFPKVLSSMKMGADRIREIVLSLRNFSHLDEVGMKPVDINEGIDNTLLILSEKIARGIEVSKQYLDLPLVECYPAEINQVFMNILSNAIDGLSELLSSQNQRTKPQIVIQTEQLDNGYVRVKFSDNGTGIAPEIIDKLFDPFFTTKDVGKGMGLGLAIAYQIIEKHRGKIEVSSEPGKGASFAIVIPIHSQDPGAIAC